MEAQTLQAEPELNTARQEDGESHGAQRALSAIDNLLAASVVSASRAAGPGIVYEEREVGKPISPTNLPIAAPLTE